MLPNTHYAEHKDDYGITSERGDSHDFEHVLAHNAVTFINHEVIVHFMGMTDDEAFDGSVAAVEEESAAKRLVEQSGCA
ncbi:hypothetical protein [Kutzneria sp. 744]|uniref:hypothetical protein n=1 Tax=Kutzneria sp. (strain 744) TaxID=345341 RepID=UPI0005B92BF2|nr:hypothetical protein [Kutzneria sp. 744]